MNDDADRGVRAPKQESNIARFRRMLVQQQTRLAPVIYVGRRHRLSFSRDRFPFASVSMLVILLSMFLLSMHLGGWSWSSWTYAFSLGIAVPLVAIEVKRRAVITGAAIILFSATALIAAGLPQSGAERLLGRGDFIVVARGEKMRVQGSYASPVEIRRIAASVQAGYSRGRDAKRVEDQAGGASEHSLHRLPAMDASGQ